MLGAENQQPDNPTTRAQRAQRAEANLGSLQHWL